MPREQLLNSPPPSETEPPLAAASQRGRPEYVPTAKDREMVQLLCAGGIKQDRIAAAIGVSPGTLAKHFEHEIKIGQTEVDALAVGTLVRAMGGRGKESVNAAKFWCATRMGWSERGVADDGDVPEKTMRVVLELRGDPAHAAVGSTADGSSGRGAPVSVARHVHLIG